jgi:hypothetical protein
MDSVVRKYAERNKESFDLMKAGLENKAVIVACDFTHRDYSGYYSNLFDEHNMSKKGLVVQSLFAPTTATEDEKYAVCHGNIFSGIIDSCFP